MTTAEQIAARDIEDIRRATEARLASPDAHPDAPTRRHVHVTDCLRGGTISQHCTCQHCTLCVCKVCGAYEGGLTTHCPGARLDVDTTMAVYRTDLDYTTTRGWHMSGVHMGERRAEFEPRRRSLTIGQLRDLYRTSTSGDVVRACLVAIGDPHFLLDGTPSDDACVAADAVALRAWGARNVAATPIIGADPLVTDEVTRLRARWDAVRPFVEAAVRLWHTDTFDIRKCRTMLDTAISKLGALASTFSEAELSAMMDVVGVALRGGHDVDALLARTREWTREEADRVLCEASGDPGLIDRRGAVLNGELLRMRREGSGVYGPAPNEPNITDDEILDLYYIANRDNDPKVQTLCEVARGDGEVSRRIARQALAPLAAKRRAIPRGK